ncbi:hypothetical protein H257_12723 [Aphanomyces astaci]|uniref:Uncharacterized protein n=2 Tax=Aphanomyces astaci TaxID=112090 RepID=W4FXN3_APHAT|nr:hypothetical protein H257_12723 [Aphanomyces astaci]ETV72260.1 hypothetical protein H257_12723 [Aphanomyces astaci]RHX98032.1 hypothetical protein DYB25_013162 [Aphanomyces astaci]RHY84371.1 hypothetical protein DYB26_013593 [Aphanomyces astaci]RHY86868.1 hypothetical protein DYB35_013542 [Aphanomyces astaci]RHZ15751.1 hypothetical protein DYB37_008724 [Aphanomyces astaci]|eukprot:XP_009838328.1 hypothetical protein H257_12723 [Aphanomyces astaci]
MDVVGSAANVMQLSAAMDTAVHLEAVVYVLLGAGLMSVYVYVVSRVDRMMQRKQFADRMTTYGQALREDRRIRAERLHRMEAILEEDSYDERDVDDPGNDIALVRMVLS